MIAAVVFLCMQGGGCSSKSILVEPRACHAPIYHVQIAGDGEWKPATVGIKCKVTK